MAHPASLDKEEVMFQSDTTPPQPWHLTNHLRRRAAERGISEAEVMGVLYAPEVTYDQLAYGPHRQVRQGGRIGVVVDCSTGAAITVVFRSRQDWADHLAGCAA